MLSKSSSTRPNQECENPIGYVSKYCSVNHVSTISLRCRKCPGCTVKRALDIRYEAKRRLLLKIPENKNLVLWTFGTNMVENEENRKKLISIWRSFMKYVRRTLKTNNFVFYVVETGKSGYLHIHALCTGFYGHKKMLDAWRKRTQMNSNVNFKAKRLDPARAVNYLTKYLTKSSKVKYYWLGVLRNCPADLIPATCNVSLLGGVKCREYIYRIVFHDLEEHYKYSKSIDDLYFCSHYCSFYKPNPNRYILGMETMYLHQEGSF